MEEADYAAKGSFGRQGEMGSQGAENLSHNYPRRCIKNRHKCIFLEFITENLQYFIYRQITSKRKEEEWRDKSFIINEKKKLFDDLGMAL
jgi:hypothetical protein